MSRARHRWPLTMGFHATSRGFGWVAFEGPFAPFDWGVVSATGDKNAVCLRALEKLLARLEPETLALEASGRRTSVRSARIDRLSKSVVALAVDRGVDVAVYTRTDIQSCFKAFGARTRQEIAEAVARHIDAFRHQLPTTRRPWDAEDRRMALFSATALVFTHFRFGSDRLLDHLRAH